MTKTGYTDSSWAVNGTITIHNPHPTLSATIESVSDLLGGIPVNPACGVTFPYTLAAGGTLTCSYSAGLPDGSSRTNTATVATSGPVDGGTGTADVIFGDPTTVVNGSVTVTDTNAAFGSPKTVSASTTWKYSRTFTCDGDESRHDNTAAITETGQHADASVEVNCYALEVTKNARTSFKRTYHWTIDKSADQTALTLALGQQFEVNYSVAVAGDLHRRQLGRERWHRDTQSGPGRRPDQQRYGRCLAGHRGRRHLYGDFPAYAPRR